MAQNVEHICDEDVDLEPPRNLNWLADDYTDPLTPFQQLVTEKDWSKSPLGPPRSWPQQLRDMYLLVMRDPSPACICWGHPSVILYNEPYTCIIGQKHPAMLGQDPCQYFKQDFGYFRDLMAIVARTGISKVEENALLHVNRYGFLEEAYFTWKFVAVTGSDGWYLGSHATVTEVTDEVIAKRRLAIVRGLGHRLSESKTIKDLWSAILRGLHGAEIDVPMAALYSFADFHEAKKLKSTDRPTPSTLCVLEGVCGIPSGHEFAPDRIDIDEDAGVPCLVRYFREAAQRSTPFTVPIEEASQKVLAKLSWEAGRPPETLVICPIKNLAILVIGLNPRRPYNDKYRNFIDLISEQITTPQLSAALLREEIEKREALARQQAIDRDRLSAELSESEMKFTGVMNRAPIGIAFMSPEGNVLSANDNWQKLTQLDVGSKPEDWGGVVYWEDFSRIGEAWARMITEKSPVVFQCEMTTEYKAPDVGPEDGKTWMVNNHILCNVYPNLDEDGNIATVLSCITDISSLKWSENQLRVRMEQAIENRKQQEKFIDMTSSVCLRQNIRFAGAPHLTSYRHEMRNPLSALIGCADQIVKSINECRAAHTPTIAQYGVLSVPDSFDRASILRLLDEAHDAADTIIYCAMHQKRIIDDILTLSKLDTKLLQITPEVAEPIELVRSIVKMFDLELKRADVKIHLIEQDSLKEMKVDWTLLDPSRVLQVLINILTNAIKFTRTETTRNVTITVGSSLTEPSQTEFGVKFVERRLSQGGQGDVNASPPSGSSTHDSNGVRQNSMDKTHEPEWGNGEPLYISVAIRDTGCGMSQEEVGNLFSLFKQASPKTYTQYGGSGLGLFISRQLVEMQGGQIGVASQKGIGSTIQFYIRTRRAPPPFAPNDTPKPFQLLIRDDALKEACSREMTTDTQGMFLNKSSFNVFSSRIKSPDPAESQSGSVPSSTTRKQLHILIVEDNLVNQKVLSKQLCREGHKVYIANHGKEALLFIGRSVYWSYLCRDDATTQPLNVVLLDLEMPVMDGIACIKRIRELQKLGEIRGHVPVLAVTANVRHDKIESCLEAGVDDVITKPYRIEDMLRLVEKVAGKFPPP